MACAIEGRRSRGFSLIELVIVVVIIGIIAAIAIPRMSRGAAGASDSALTANLAVLRNAIDLFQTEHGGRYPPGADIVSALTTYSDDATPIAYSATKTASFIFGPYLRVVPPLPVGTNKGKNDFALGATPAGAQGWLYNAATGAVVANLPDSDVDTRGVKYNSY